MLVAGPIWAGKGAGAGAAGGAAEDPVIDESVDWFVATFSKLERGRA
jgi:hypothetical protein